MPPSLDTLSGTVSSIWKRLFRNSLDSFTYTPLHDDDEIRLLILAPRPRNSEPFGSRRLGDSIQHVRLSASPLYTAVSWMWGKHGDRVDFEVDGHTLRVQRNLKRIIQHLRHDSQTRRVWIDAVCIDQTSIQERNHQVQMMGRIYGNANYVVACLTDTNALIRNPFDLQTPKNASSLTRREASDVHSTLYYTLHETEEMGIIGSSSRYPNPISQWSRFLENEYFTRRWIIQEITLAQSVTFCCDGYLMPMSTVREAIQSSRIRRPDSGPSELHHQAMRLCSTDPQTSSYTSMEDLLYLHERAECSDFHDKVYALISLTPNAQVHLPVDYNASRAQLLLTVFNFSLTYQDLSTFRILGFMSFLRQHLEVSREELHGSIHDPETPLYSTNIAVRGIVRGWISTAHPGLLVEIDQEGLRDPQPGAIVGIPGIDQNLFTLTNHKPGDSRNGDSSDRATGWGSPPKYKPTTQSSVCAGLACTRVQYGDEIWQFEDTPVAVIARKTARGYSWIGRAFLIRDHQRDRSSLKNSIAWIRDSTKHSRATPVIHVDLKGLYELMTWVNLDQ
ncbi:hypothetical protein AYO21_03251 [Fonsecaea monophora]|uniref:Heterokaryon incompatibility domain-containing protein n=1 Tax=Fonsecaea monophora TaxID=254056 RepID=A0A177FDM2_9EURO|nr:hypothetical protein AYO21_03251 [Fonsecaea monophora]OAG42375.1 hypothetical protein AYO21_03251 [Fonsecaea monophora]